MSKVLLGMSGGVDSSAAAMVLIEKGYDVTGVTVQMFHSCNAAADGEACSDSSDIEDAKAVALKLGFEHRVLDFSDDFKKYVTDDFIRSYVSGRTPNPCICCNRHIKFGKMLEYAQENGFDYIATGHYAHKEYDEKKGRYILKRPKDISKDQTYVLYCLTQKQLEKVIFPLADISKLYVRSYAEEAGLVNSDKPDSQDICFVPDGKYAEFIKKHTSDGSQPGNFEDIDGNIFGTHSGIINYTIGQRKGLGIALGKPVFVVKKDAASNTVVLGDSEQLMTDTLIADDVNFISIGELTGSMRVTAKARYNQKDQPAVISMMPDGRVKVVFDSPQRAVTSGQAVVFYDGDIVVGGGTIC